MTYAGCGYFLSTWSFSNLIVVAAWAPGVLWALVRGGRRGLCLGGLFCGLMLLGGEPATAFLIAPVFLLAATIGRSFPRGLLVAAGVGFLGLLVALPQLVATAAVLSESMRGQGFDFRLSALQALHPARLLELFLPLPFGIPTEFGKQGTWSKAVTPEVPYIFTLYAGILAPLALVLGRGQARRWVVLAGLGLAIPILASRFPGVVETLLGGWFRYPQKFLVWFALGVSVAVGLGLEALLTNPRVYRWFGAVGVALGLGGVLVWFGRSACAGLLTEALGGGGSGSLEEQLGLWAVWLGLSATLLLVAAWAVKGERTEVLVWVQIASLLQLIPLLAGDGAAFYQEPPPLARALEERRSILVAGWMVAPWEPRQRYPQELANTAGLARLTYLDLEPWIGVKIGLRYPLAPDLEGIYSRRWYELGERIRQLGWEERIPWFRRLGVEAIVRTPGPSHGGVETLARLERFGVPVELVGVRNVLPVARWPAQALIATDLEPSVRAVALGAIGDDTVFLPQELDHKPGGKVALLEESPDRVLLEVESEGGVIVLQRSYWSFYQARLGRDGAALSTVPVDFALLGVIVPPGRFRVEIEARVPGLAVGSVLAVLAAAALGGAGVLRERRR